MANHTNGPTLNQGSEVLRLVGSKSRDQLTDLLSSGLLAELLRSDPKMIYGIRRKPVLCYVDEYAAYFTTQELCKQWGDDWNDAPYEHNAGSPYRPCWHNESEHVAKRGGLCTCNACKDDWYEDGTPRWEIIKVTWYGPFATPAMLQELGSPYSVEDINTGKVPWLYSEGLTPVWAGMPLDHFTRLMATWGRVEIVKQ